MELVEVVIEGLRGFRQMWRMPLAQGLTLLHPADGRAELIREVVLDLLYPKGTEPTLQQWVDHEAPQSRIGLLVTARDGAHYRILRDVRTGKTSLLRQGQGGFAPVSDRAAEIAQMVTAQIGFPQEDVLREVFFTSLADLPSQRPDALEISNPNAPAPPSASQEGAAVEESGKRSAWNKPLPPGFEDAGAAASNEFVHLSRPEQEQRLAELTAQLSKFDSVRELEFELDGLQKKGFSLDERLRPIDHLRRQLKQAEEALAGTEVAADIPDDLPRQRQERKTRVANHQAQLGELAQRKERLEEKLKAELARSGGAGQIVQAAFQEPFIRWGVVGGVGALAIGIVGFFSLPSLRYVALLDAVGFAVALVGAWRFIADAEQAAVLKGQIALLDREREKLESSFEIEDSHFKALLKRYQVKDEDQLDELEARVRRHHEALHARDAARAAMEEATGGDDVESLVKEREELSARVKDLEEQLYEAGGFLGNRKDVETQIAALQDLLAGKAPAQEPVAERAPEPSQPRAPVPSSPGGELDTVKRMKRLVGHASDLFVQDLDSTCSTLAPRAGQYVSGLSDRRYGQMIFGPKGEVSLVESASGRAIPFGMLTPGDRDLAYLALKMTVVEAAVRRARLPVFLDRAFETFQDLKHPLLVRMVQFLAQGTQVVLMTRKASMAAAGGQPVAIPPP